MTNVLDFVSQCKDWLHCASEQFTTCNMKGVALVMNPHHIRCMENKVNIVFKTCCTASKLTKLLKQV